MNIIGSYCKRIKSWVTAAIATHTAIVSAHHTDHKVASAESAEFKNVNIPVDEAYKQATKIILRIKDLNTFIGENAGKVTTGNYNNFMGYAAGYSNTTGNYNNFVGYATGYANTTGYNNNFMGYAAGYSNTTGYENNFVGREAGRWNTTGNYNNFMGYTTGYANTTGYNNNFMGYAAGYSNTTGNYNNFMGGSAGRLNTTGNQNNFMGYAAGYSNTTGYNNNFMGYAAGYYETGSDKLFIDNTTRANEADGRIKTLIYGVFDAATANQLLRINAKKVELPQLGNYADDAAAATGGIAVGGLYHNAGNVRVRIA